MHFIQTLQEWWHQQSYLELTGVLTGLLCVYLAAINNIWNWPFAIINTAIYIYIFAMPSYMQTWGRMHIC